MQSSGKLRKKLSVKSAQFEALKNEYSKLLSEKLVLNEDHKKLKDDLKLAIETIELLCEKNEISEEIRSNTIGSYRDKIDRLIKELNMLAGAPTNFSEKADSTWKVSDIPKEKITESDVTFSSRFMPNVAFLVNKDDYSQLDLDFITEREEIVIQTDENGGTERILFNAVFNELNLVSKYLAAPELVPEGMVYDKDSDSLSPFATGGIIPDDFHNSCLDSASNKQREEKKGFSSRFMPNVKFKTDTGNNKQNRDIELFFNKNMDAISNIICDVADYMLTSNDGKSLIMCDSLFYANQTHIKEVSIYEAIPGFVPKGMVYYPKRDVLVKKVCDNQMHQGEFYDCDDQISFDAYERSLFFGKFPFTEIQSKKVLDKFGFEEGEKLLELCVHHNINPDELI